MSSGISGISPQRKYKAAIASLALASASIMASSCALAARVVDFDADFERSFREPVINANGTVAYTVIQGSTGGGPDEITIWRDGTQQLAVGQFEGFGNVAITDAGLIAFIGTEQLDSEFMYDGVFTGANPPGPSIDDRGRYLALRFDGSTIVANPRRIPFDDGEPDFDPNTCDFEFAFSGDRLSCDGNLYTPERIYSAGSNTGVFSRNQQWALRYRSGQGPQNFVELRQYDSVEDQFVSVGDDYAEATRGQLGVFDAWIADNGIAVVFGLRLPDQVRGVYQISQTGQISTLLEPFSGVVLGITDSGHAVVSGLAGDGGSFYSTQNPAQSFVRDGDAIGDYVLVSVSSGEAAFANNRIATLADLCELQDRTRCGTGVVVLDGTTVPAPDPDVSPPLVRWNSNVDGSFFESANWDPQMVPDSEQIALFDSDIAVVDVQFSGMLAQSLELRIHNGTYDFQGGVYQVLRGTPSVPSLEIRNAFLFLEQGQQLQTNYARLIGGAQIGGGVGLRDAQAYQGNPSRWENTGELVVDSTLSVQRSGGVMSDSLVIGSAAGSDGAVDLATDANLSICETASIAAFGNTVVGDSGTGLLEIGGRCVVESLGPRLVGNFAGSDGSVVVNKASWLREYNPGPAQPLTIGRAGTGLLSVIDGHVGGSRIIIGDYPGSLGSLVVETRDDPFSLLEAEETLLVGNRGTGEINVFGEGQVAADTLTMAALAGSEARIMLSGIGPSGGLDPALDVAGLVTVSDGGNAELVIENGARMEAADGIVGGGLLGAGLVIITSGGTWVLEGNLQVGASQSDGAPEECSGFEQSLGQGEIRALGDGVNPDVAGQTVLVDGPASTLSGTGLLRFNQFIVENCGSLQPGASPGELTLDGDLAFSGGQLEIEIAGLESGQHDVLSVTGSANISGGIVRFQFRDFLPKQGDQVAFLSAATLSLGTSIQYEYEGAEPGFEFTVDVDAGGNLVFTALNDAVGPLLSDGFEDPDFGN